MVSYAGICDNRFSPVSMKEIRTFFSLDYSIFGRSYCLFINNVLSICMYHTTYIFGSGGYVAKSLGENFSPLFYSLDILTLFLNKISMYSLTTTSSKA